MQQSKPNKLINVKRFCMVLLQKCYFQKCLGALVDQSVSVRMFTVHTIPNWMLGGALCVLKKCVSSVGSKLWKS